MILAFSLVINVLFHLVTSNKEAVQYKTNYFNFGYGYLWWVWDTPFDNGSYKRAYSAIGAFGQFITVMPALDLVIAHKTNYEDYQRTTSTEKYLKMISLLVEAKLK